MKVKSLIKSLSILFALLLFQSCGSELGGSATEFQTVYLTVNSGTGKIEADVAKHSDVKSCGALTDTITIPASDDLSVIITSNLYPGFSAANASNVVVKSATWTYAPRTISGVIPIIPSQSLPFTAQITPGGSTTIAIPVGLMQIKQALYSDLVCAFGLIYDYYVTVSIQVEEINTGKQGVITAYTSVHFSDWSDK